MDIHSNVHDSLSHGLSPYYVGTLKIVITDPAFCGESTSEVEVDPCLGEGEEDGESFGCGGLRVLLAVAAALAILAGTSRLVHTGS